MEEGYTILLAFDDIVLQNTQSCDAKYLKVYEGHTPNNSSLLET